MKETNIEWCDSTINGSSGCDGCELWNEKRKSCYAGIVHEGRWAKSLAVTHPDLYSPSFSDVKMIPGRFAKAAGWSDLRGKDRPDKPWLNGLPRMIFVGDMGDFLSRDVTDEFLINELFAAITSQKGQRHFWLLLTKKPARLVDLSRRIQGGLPANCMAMTSATDQRTANIRIQTLLEVKCHWRGVSCEPLLGPVDLCDLKTASDPLAWKNALTGDGMCDGMNEPAKGPALDWVIGGFESGNGWDQKSMPRPGDPKWIRDMGEHCFAFSVPFFFKQWGAWFPADADHQNLFSKSIGHQYVGERSQENNGLRQMMMRVGKATAGAMLDSKESRYMPILSLSPTDPAGAALF